MPSSRPPPPHLSRPHVAPARDLRASPPPPPPPGPAQPAPPHAVPVTSPRPRAGSAAAPRTTLLEAAGGGGSSAQAGGQRLRGGPAQGHGGGGAGGSAEQNGAGSQLLGVAGLRRHTPVPPREPRGRAEPQPRPEHLHAAPCRGCPGDGAAAAGSERSPSRKGRRKRLPGAQRTARTAGRCRHRPGPWQVSGARY